MTPQKIADDVQQTFDNVSNSYRSLLQRRIELAIEDAISKYKNSLANRLKQCNICEAKILRDDSR